MTLIVAEATEDGPRIVSDALVTFSEEPRSNYTESILKVVVISPDITICFAGDVHAGLML